MIPLRPPPRAAALPLLALALQACVLDVLSLDRTTTLRAAQARWEAAGIGSYAYTLARECDCPPAVREPVRVEVRGGAPASVTVLATGAPASPEIFGRFDTVEELFGFIERAVRDRAFAIRALYDEGDGHPVYARVKYPVDRAAADGGFAVTDFEVR